MKKIAVVLPSSQDKQELSRIFSNASDVLYIEDRAFLSYEPMKDGFDVISFVDRCLKEIKDHGSGAVFYSDDLANLICSIVSKALGLPGSTIESMVRANHKYYGRQSERYPIRHETHLIDSTSGQCDLPFPVQVKPSSLYFSLLQATARTTEEFVAAIEQIRSKAPAWEKPFIDIFSKYADPVLFPLANRHMFVIEEHISYVSQHAVEGWSDAEGNTQIWAVSDNNYFKECPGALNYNSYPSSLPSEESTRLEMAAADVARRFGLKNTFWNVELWICTDRSIKVTEVNGRICGSMTPLYKAVSGHSQYPTAVKVHAGLSATSPLATSPSSGVGGMFSIASPNVGLVRSLIDTDQLLEMADNNGVVKTKLIYPDDVIINWHQSGGRCCLGRAWIVGEDLREIETKAELVRKRVLR